MAAMRGGGRSALRASRALATNLVRQLLGEVTRGLVIGPADRVLEDGSERADDRQIVLAGGTEDRRVGR